MFGKRRTKLDWANLHLVVLRPASLPIKEANWLWNEILSLWGDSKTDELESETWTMLHHFKTKCMQTIPRYFMEHMRTILFIGSVRKAGILTDLTRFTLRKASAWLSSVPEIHLSLSAPWLEVVLFSPNKPAPLQTQCFEQRWCSCELGRGWRRHRVQPFSLMTCSSTCAEKCHGLKPPHLVPDGETFQERGWQLTSGLAVNLL